MRSSRVLEERKRRVKVLFKELGYRVVEGRQSGGTYTAGFKSRDLMGGLYIDRESRFVELSYTFSLPPGKAEYLRRHLEEMLRICYEYGCYVNLQRSQEEIAFTIFTKEYFAGLNYYSLRDNLTDFIACIDALDAVLEDGKERSESE